MIEESEQRSEAVEARQKKRKSEQYFSFTAEEKVK